MSNQRKYQNVIKEIPHSAVDIYRSLPEGTRCEVIHNELCMSPDVSKEHQIILISLTALLHEYLKDNPVGTLLELFDVYFDDQLSVVRPDLIIVANDQEHLIKNDGVYGVPPLIIEIMSKNCIYETQRKRMLYEKAGVQEYFLIDPDKTTTLLELNAANEYDQSYVQPGTVTSKILHHTIVF